MVPVVGQELLTIRDNGKDSLLYPLLATRLADYLGVANGDLPAGGELNTIACRFLAAGNQLEDLYPALKSVMPKATELAVPEPLLRLAEIPNFKLFVSTTFDPLLARALDQVRHGGQEKTEVYSYSPEEVGDLPNELDQLLRPAVYHLFGKLSAFPAFAVTQEDTLEFVHALQSDSRQPPLLFDELGRRSLLVLGSSFGGWLARFFLRAAKRQRLRGGRGSDYVADDTIRGDANLVLFLHHFSSSKIFESGDSVEFVDELARRWRERHPASGAVDAQRVAESVGRSSQGPEPGAVFLSYASEDRAVVDKIRVVLEAAGVDVFFDKTDLRTGDDFEARLLRSIRDCSVFVPVISSNTLTGLRRFFRIEWSHALEEARKVASGQRFILPVVVDSTSPRETAVEAFSSIHWERLPAGEATPEFVGEVKQLFERHQELLRSRG